MDANGYHVIRAIRGPIMLITLGVLFALQNFTPFGFDKTWPVLLVVFGLLSLMQRGAAPPLPPMPQAPPPPAPPRYASTGYAQSPYAQPPAGSGSTTTPPPPPTPDSGGAQ